MTLTQTSLNGQRVRFDVGVRHRVGEELDRLGAGAALVLSTPQQTASAEEVSAALGNKTKGVFAEATMHTPVDVTERAVEHLRISDADCLVSIGGGSTIGLGKAMSLRTGLPHITIPTTYAGSEATPILGQTEDGVKTTKSDAKILPAVILYDPELVATLPVNMTVTSALNAIAHSVEALYAQDRTPETTALALEGISAFATGLPEVIKAPGDLKARADTLRGAWACGTVLGMVGMALHHKLCHTLGGSLNLPHAETHAIILPHATSYNEVAVPDLLAPLVEIFDGDTPGQALWSFAKRMGAPLSLRDLGVTDSDIDKVVDIALRNPYWNPRDVTEEGLISILDAALLGEVLT